MGLVKQRQKITVHLHKDGIITVERNYKVELRILGGTRHLLNELTRLLVDENDYENFLKFYDSKDDHLSNWLFNIFKLDVDREFISQFYKIETKV